VGAGPVDDRSNRPSLAGFREPLRRYCRPDGEAPRRKEDKQMVILGIILALIGWIASISILLWIGVILIIVGLVLNFVPIGGSTRRWY
jgi:hypothetical protein